MIATIKQADAIMGGLGNAKRKSKMPGRTYGIPAWRCKIGSKLRAAAGTTCSDCYALKGSYAQYPRVLAAQERRFESLRDPRWVEATALAINRQAGLSRPEPERYFRWHDSGDIQDVGHLDRIVQVARLTPDTRHWLPTREYRIVAIWRKLYGMFPENLTVRLSAHKIDGPAPDVGLPTSTVSKDRAPQGYACPAPTQGNNCGDCRVCWDGGVANSGYHLH